MDNIWTRTRGWLILSLFLTGSTGLGILGWTTWNSFRKTPLPEGLRRVSVQRKNLNVTLRAGGRVESEKKTLIECEIENVRYSTGGGNSINTGNRTTILEIVPDGSKVKQGDVLCRLDSAAYEEVVRQQAIRVQQSRNDLLKARLDVKAAEIALTEYRDGVLPNQTQQIDGQIVMANSDHKRQTDRLEWARRMLKNGYISGGQYATEQQKMLQVETNRDTLIGQKSLLTKYQGPIRIANLEMTLNSARTTLAFEELRCKRTEEILRRFRRQVELCTVKAPHDGFVIYANEEDRDPRVQLGAEVYQRMDLFYLPDLNEMEVETTLHETVVQRVKEGMGVRVRVETMPQYELEGHVKSVATLPIAGPRWWDNGVKNYLAKVRLHSVPEGVLPGMTAEVEIDAGNAENALVVPAGAVVADGGHDYCYVTRDQKLERREVELGQVTQDYLEIRDGLEEGEFVVENPSTLDESVLQLAVVTDLIPDSATATIDSDTEPATE